MQDCLYMWKMNLKHEYNRFLSILVMVQMETQITETYMVEDDFSISFMFSTIYLILEGSVSPPPPPPRIEMLEAVQMETQITETYMVEDDFSIAFMFSTIYLRLEGNVPPPANN